MKKIRLLVATISMVMVATMTFGQSITVTDIPVKQYASGAFRPAVTVEWYRADGLVITETVFTTESAIASGVTVTDLPPYFALYSEILTIKIYVYFANETHYAVYPGSATSANRLLEPQYWVVVPD